MFGRRFLLGLLCLLTSAAAEFSKILDPPSGMVELREGERQRETSHAYVCGNESDFEGGLAYSVDFTPPGSNTSSKLTPGNDVKNHLNSSGIHVLEDTNWPLPQYPYEKCDRVTIEVSIADYKRNYNHNNVTFNVTWKRSGSVSNPKLVGSFTIYFPLEASEPTTAPTPSSTPSTSTSGNVVGGQHQPNGTSSSEPMTAFIVAVSVGSPVIVLLLVVIVVLCAKLCRSSKIKDPEIGTGPRPMHKTDKIEDTVYIPGPHDQSQLSSGTLNGACREEETDVQNTSRDKLEPS